MSLKQFNIIITGLVRLGYDIKTMTIKDLENEYKRLGGIL